MIQNIVLVYRFTWWNRNLDFNESDLYRCSQIEVWSLKIKAVCFAYAGQLNDIYITTQLKIIDP